MISKPPPIIVDSNLSWDYFNLLKNMVPGEIIYVNDTKNMHRTNGDMSDDEIKKLQIECLNQ